MGDIHFYNQYLLSANYVSDTILDTGDKSSEQKHSFLFLNSRQ